jgi:hypothetical protein
MTKLSELKSASQIAAEELADPTSAASTSEPRWRMPLPCG